MGSGGKAGGTPAPRPRGLVYAVVTVIVLSCCPLAAAGSEPPKLVVVLPPHGSDGVPGILQINRAIHSTFASDTPVDDSKWHIVEAVSHCLVQAVLIAGLLVQRVRRRRAVDALGESESRFRRMADAAPILIWTSGPDKGCTFLNRAWQEFTGRPLEGELGDGWAEGVHSDDLPRCLEVYATHFDARVPFEMAYRLRRHDGEYRWVTDRGVPRLSPDGEFAGYVGTCADITERKRAEDGLRESRQETRLLTGRLLEAQEVERRRIARELHDDLNQRLALLALELDTLSQVPPTSAAEIADRMQELSARVKDLSSAVHDLSHRLHPSKLEQLGLVAALGGLCRELTQSHGLEVKFTHHQGPGVMPPDSVLCLYRIAQEALQNVVKHSGSRHAAVELSGTADEVRLRVIDDGVGFEPGSAVGNDGLGLISMRERLLLVGGEITIDSRPLGGTRIDVRVPVTAQAT
ncbi:MAG TPA: PAS domain-containing sensor histidine kinase [Gemmataceae bacterium]|nr:PAS domain-containing sensor histidine kinase [Gemmataceae bacterium]